MNRNLAFDSIRWLMAVVIVMHHVFINFYKGLPSMRCFSGGYLAVEAFFIISGFLMMKSFFSYQQKYADFSPYQQLKFFSLSRIRRLYPEFIFIFLITVAVRAILDQATPWHLWLPNLLMLGNFCGIQGIVRDTWFISSLFWISIFIFGMMLLYNKKFYLFYFPIAVFFCFIFLVTVPKVLSIHSDAMYFNIISGGGIRAFTGIGIGMMAYICKDYFYRISNNLIKILEITCTIYSIYIISHGYIKFEPFNFYVSFSIITIILYNRQETFLKILSWKGLEKISASSYMLFLSHLLIVENLSRYFKNHILQFNPMLSIFVITIFSAFSGYILYKIFLIVSKSITPFILKYMIK